MISIEILSFIFSEYKPFFEKISHRGTNVEPIVSTATTGNVHCPWCVWKYSITFYWKFEWKSRIFLHKWRLQVFCCWYFQLLFLFAPRYGFLRRIHKINSSSSFFPGLSVTLNTRVLIWRNSHIVVDSSFQWLIWVCSLSLFRKKRAGNLHLSHHHRRVSFFEGSVDRSTAYSHHGSSNCQRKLRHFRVLSQEI